MENIIRKYPKRTLLILTALILAFFVLSYFNVVFDYERMRDFKNVYYVITLLISAILVLIAFLKSQEAIDQSKLNYLLRIDERWSSTEIIKAREVIHGLYLDAKKRHDKYTNEQITPVIAQAIMELHSNQKKYRILLNF